MEKHKVIIESGFGNYLVGKKPKGTANAFLYYKPSLLLLIDEIVCDKHALEGERLWAKEGFVISEVFVRLENEGIVKSKNFNSFFKGEIKDILVEESKIDFQKAKEENIAPTSTIDPENLDAFENNGFFDINSMLYLSSVLKMPYLEVEETSRYYEWKFRNIAWFESGQDNFKKETAVLTQMLNLCVPSFELFPKNKEFLEADDSTKNLYNLFHEYRSGNMDLIAYRNTYKMAYSDFLEKWKRYDSMVRSQALDNFEMLIEFRNNKMFKSLRCLLGEFSRNVSRHNRDEDFNREVNLRIKREILEIEIELVGGTKYDFLDKLESYISFPVEISSILLGTAVSYFSQNPLFLLLSSTPSGMKWLANIGKDKNREKISWYFYLLDFNKKLDKKMKFGQ